MKRFPSIADAGSGFLLLLVIASAPLISNAQEGTILPWQCSASLQSSYNDNRDGVASNRQGSLSVSATYRASRRFCDGDRTTLDLTIAPVVRWLDDAQSNTTNRNNSSNRGLLGATALFGSLDINLSHALTPTLLLTLGDTLRYSDDTASADPGTSQAQRTPTTSLANNAFLGAQQQLTPDTALSGNGSWSAMRYADRAAAQERNSDTYVESATITHRFSPKLSVNGQGSVSEFQSPANGGSNNSMVLSFSVGASRIFTPDLIANVSLSCQNNQPAYGDSSGVTLGGGADLLLQATTPTRYHLSANYGYQNSGQAGNAMRKTLALSGSVEHDLIADRLLVALQLRYTDSQAASESTIPALTRDESETMESARVSGTYRLTPAWSATCGITVEQWRSTTEDSFQRNTVDLSMQYTW